MTSFDGINIAIARHNQKFAKVTILIATNLAAHLLVARFREEAMATIAFGDRISEGSNERSNLDRVRLGEGEDVKSETPGLPKANTRKFFKVLYQFV